MKKIFEINREEVEKKADEYVKSLKYDASDDEKAEIKKMYVANGLRQLEKMKNAYDLEYRRVQKIVKKQRKQESKILLCVKNIGKDKKWQ